MSRVEDTARAEALGGFGGRGTHDLKTDSRAGAQLPDGGRRLGTGDGKPGSIQTHFVLLDPNSAFKF